MMPVTHSIRRTGAASFFAILAFTVLSLSSIVAEADPAAIAVLRTLDKVTARVATIEVPVGEATTVGSLAITVRACDKRPPEETPESAAFLEIVENRPNEAPQPRFTGWMFASSPALNALEHPVYDVWVIDCVNEATTESDTSQ